MGKRVVFALLVATIIALGLVGCGSSGTSSSQASQAASSSSSASAQQSQSQESVSSSAAAPQDPDAEFLPELTAGLEARWMLSKQTEGRELTVQLREQLANAELEHLAAFKEASFKDAELGKLAERYIAALEESVSCLASNDTNYMDLAKRWNDAYKERALVIKDLVEKYGFKMSGDNQSNLDSVVEDAKFEESSLNVPEDIRKAADEEIPAAALSAFQKVDGNTYRATVVNPSRASFDYYNLVVCLLNDRGGLVEDHMITVDNWASGAEAVFEFTTDAEFARIDGFDGNWWATWQN